MTEPVKREHPWLTKFQRAPDIALDELLRGIADIEPYERARPTDVLVMFFGGLEPADPLHQSLDETLGAWLVSRRKDSPERRREYGLNSYIEELIQALSATYRLSLPHTAESLRRDFSIFQRWLDSFYLGPDRDPSGELWRVMALTQTDRDFLKDWYRLCRYAGHIFPINYLSLGLLGLRMLPQDNGRQNGRLNPEFLAGLFKWGATLDGNKSDKQAFLRQLSTIKVLYPRGPGTWRDILAPLVSEYKRPVFYLWLKGAGIQVKGTRKTRGQTGTSLPPRDRLQRLLLRLKKEPVGQVLPDIRLLMEDYERYAEATGDEDPFVKSAGNFAKHLKKRAPHYALELVRAANRWQPYNPYLWSLWAQTLEILNKNDKQAFLRQLRTIKVLYPRGPGTWRDILAPLVSEYRGSVFYPWLKGAGIQVKGTRKTRGQTGTSLPPRDRWQRLLQRLKKEPVGQVLPDIRSLMEDYERYAEATGDDDPFVKSAGNFAKHLKKRAPHYALELVRAANRWQPYNPYLWSLWAQTLEILNKDDLAEVVYWEAIRRIPENVIFRTALANLLARTDREEEAEKLFRDTMKRFPENEVCRNALANLLARIGREEEAEKLFRDTMKKIPKDEVCRNALANLLARTGRGEKAEELFRDTMEKFPEDEVCMIDLAFWLLTWRRIEKAEGLYQKIVDRFQINNYIRKLGEVINACRGGTTEEFKMPEFADLQASEFDLDDRTAFLTSAALESQKETPSQVMQPSTSDGSHQAELRAQDVPFMENLLIGHADFCLNTNKDQEIRDKALSDIEDVLENDPGHVYPRVVLCMHEEIHRQKLVDQVDAFPHAYPLRFLAASESGTSDKWDALAKTFPMHSYLTLLGRISSYPQNADTQLTVKRLRRWLTSTNGDTNGFEKYTKGKVQEWMPGIDEELDDQQLRQNVTDNIDSIKTLIYDGLKRTADEHVRYAA